MTASASILGSLPASNAVVKTASDTVPLEQPSRAIYIGGTGHLEVHMVGAAPTTYVLFSALPVGTILPIAVDYVRATNTTASLIVVMW
jgi:hypothetical protein